MMGPHFFFSTTGHVVRVPCNSRQGVPVWPLHLRFLFLSDPPPIAAPGSRFDEGRSRCEGGSALVGRVGAGSVKMSLFQGIRPCIVCTWGILTGVGESNLSPQGHIAGTQKPFPV